MQAQGGNPAVRNGFLFGIIIAVLGIINSVVSYFTTPTSSSATTPNAFGLLGCLFFLVYLALFFVAGMMTARQTGTVGSGAITGLIAGLVGGVVSGIVGVVVVVIRPPVVDTAGTNLTQSELQTAIIIGAIVGVVLVLLVEAGLGAGLGALGALVGRGQYQTQHPAAAYQDSMYQGIQQPGYPPQPGYPAPGAYPPPPAAPGYPPQPGQPGQPGQQWPQYPPSNQPPQQ